MNTKKLASKHIIKKGADHEASPDWDGSGKRELTYDLGTVTESGMYYLICMALAGLNGGRVPEEYRALYDVVYAKASAGLTSGPGHDMAEAARKMKEEAKKVVLDMETREKARQEAMPKPGDRVELSRSYRNFSNISGNRRETPLDYGVGVVHKIERNGDRVVKFPGGEELTLSSIYLVKVG